MADLIQIFADNLLPILLIAGVGFVIKRRFDVHPRTVSVLLFNVFSPSLVFSQILKSKIAGDEFIRIFAGTILFQLSVALIAYTAAKLQRASPTERV